jgi:hypothetical protein
MRKFSRTWVEKYPSIARTNEAIADQRRLGSEHSVENYIKRACGFSAFIKCDDPEIASHSADELKKLEDASTR